MGGIDFAKTNNVLRMDANEESFGLGTDCVREKVTWPLGGTYPPVGYTLFWAVWLPMKPTRVSQAA